MRSGAESCTGHRREGRSGGGGEACCARAGLRQGPQPLIRPGRRGWQALAPRLGLGEQSASRERAERMRAKGSFLSGVFLEGRH